MGAEAKQNIFERSERFVIRAYEGESSLPMKQRIARFNKRVAKMSPEKQVTLIMEGGLSFKDGKVVHVSRWREEADGSWDFKEYLGEYPSKTSVTAVHGSNVEFTQ